MMIKNGEVVNPLIFVKRFTYCLIYSHLIRVIKLFMPPNNHYVNGNEIMYDVHQNVNQVIASMEVDD
jgi:hypothetical protein